jgi:FkbM family methyltransferase
MLNVKFIRQVGPVKWLYRYSWLQVRKRLFKSETRLRLPTGGFLTLPKHSGGATEVFVTNANIDWGSEALFARFADQKRDFLDLGSHIGYYSVYLAPRVRRVYAFEPDSRNLASLQANAAAAENIEVIQMAVSSYDGVSLLQVGGGSTDSSLVDAAGGEAVVNVKVTTIDSFLNSRNDTDVALIKIDIEGHDLKALQGMHQTIADHQPLILTESVLDSDLREICTSWGYRIFAFVRDRKTLQTNFRELSESLDDPWCKMLFLVPKHLVATFSQIAAENPKENGRGSISSR